LDGDPANSDRVMQLLPYFHAAGWTAMHAAAGTRLSGVVRGARRTMGLPSDALIELVLW
jgi:hypothetical protein